MNQLDVVLSEGSIDLLPNKDMRYFAVPQLSSRFQKSFAARTITEGNSLSDSITSLASVSSFRSQLSAINTIQ